jgi:MoxR-like ATPase
MAELRSLPGRILDEVATAVVGKRELKRLLLIGMLAGGHVLIEGPQGTGKTTIARSFCRALGGVFKRIQFTPDMLPSDVTGFNVYRPDGDSRFVEGPVFASVVLADELNRTTPRTQSALLEAMQEGQVTVDGFTRLLPRPMMVIGSQLPYGGPGTYPLTVVQADRFLLHAWSDMPSPVEEREIVGSIDRIELADVRPVVSPEDILALRREVTMVHASPLIVEYILALLEHVRRQEALSGSVSTRVGISLFKCARAAAYLDERDYVVPDDVKQLLPNVMFHRLALTADAEAEGVRAGDIVQAALDSVTVPKGPLSAV